MAPRAMDARSRAARPIRVVVVDDSRLMRGIIKAALEVGGGIEIAGMAGNVAEGRQLIRSTDPDAVTLDVEMPGMNGLEFLEKIMTLRPTPVVMVSSLTAAGAEATLTALSIGAVDVVCKPSGPDPLGAFGEELRAKVRLAARAQVRRRSPISPPPAGNAPPQSAPARRPQGPARSTSPRDLPQRVRATPAHAVSAASDAPTPAMPDAPTPAAAAQAPPPPAAAATGGWKRGLIAIGASTGGVGALGELLEGLPPDLPPVVITQHMPPGYTDRFAQRLRAKLRRDVAEGRDGETLVPGMVRIAPGGRHMEVQARDRRFVTRLGGEDPVGGHCPSVDVLFGAVARAAGPSAVGAILTGMGRDGAAGLRAMRGAGAATLGQSERTCVVYGMPKAAHELGGVEEELDLDRLAARICDFARSAPSRRAAP